MFVRLIGMKTRVLQIMGVLYFSGVIFLSGGANASSIEAIQLWDKILKVDTNEGYVNYKAIKLNDKLLKSTINSVESITKFDFDSLTDKELMAFWINAYNIGVVKTIIDHYPIKRSFGLKAVRYPANSIQQIDNVWDNPVLAVRGKNLSLNDIENKVLRPQFKDPRVHFAIVCASVGCPSIRSESYTAEKLDQQLSEQIQIFINDSTKIRYDAQNDILFLSPIFKWFKEDFDQVGGAVAFIKRYDIDHKFDALTEKTKIQWLGYDWSLNDSHE